jgi:hypothetical protein
VSILIVFIVSFFSIYFGASVTTNWYQSLGFIWLGESVRVRVRVVQKYCSKAVEHSSEVLFINTVHLVLSTEHCYCSLALYTGTVFKITGRKVLSTDNIVV